MDLIQLLLFWSLAVNVQLVDFAKHRDRLQLLQRVERRVADQRHRRMHLSAGRLPSKSHGTELSSVTIVHETGKAPFSCSLYINRIFMACYGFIAFAALKNYFSDWQLCC